jgi:hypothetical protein
MDSPGCGSPAEDPLLAAPMQMTIGRIYLRQMFLIWRACISLNRGHFSILRQPG